MRSAAHPPGETTPAIDRPSALIAPTFGSCWYMIRHVTPVAKAEIAIGRKTTVLNATDQRTRSVSTAKRSPIAVTKAGTTATQIALFLIAVVSVEVVKRRLVVVDPDEGAEVARLPEEAAGDRVHGRIDDPDAEHDESRREEERARR